MSADPQFSCKIATEPSEFEQIHRLNYQTFVTEIPQHDPSLDRRLVDRYHAQNTYLIALAGDQLVGMVAVRDQRPFSLDEKLPDLDFHLPPSRKLCELRLLSVIPSHRNGRVFQGLLTLLLDHARRRGYDLAVISGSLRQSRLYQHLGFCPFGPEVGPPKARYQPMYLHLFADYLRDLDLQRLRPQGATVRLRPAGWSAMVLADPGRDYAILIVLRWGCQRHAQDGPLGLASSAAVVELDLPPGQYSVRWLDPVTGRKLAEEQHQHRGGLAVLNPPSFRDSLAGSLQRIGNC
jgi:predicted N-acetyltransferase YhbS